MGSPAMARILLLSNGHGEDLSGALLAQELQQQGHNVQALPLAGLGSAYQKAGVPLTTSRFSDPECRWRAWPVPTVALRWPGVPAAIEPNDPLEAAREPGTADG